MQENDSINTITSSSGDQVFLFDSTRTEKDSLYTGTNYSPRIIQKKWSPKYIYGFETQCHRPVTDPLTDFKETSITIPIGFEATPRPHTPVHNSSIALLLITGFLLIAIFYHRGIKYLIQAFSNITEVKDRHSIFTNITVNETQLRFALLFQTFITEGIALFFLINNFWEIQSENSLSLAIIFCCLSAAVFYWIQMFIYHLLGFVFSDPARTRQCVESFSSVNSLLGLVLFPVVLCMIYIPACTSTMLLITGICYILSRIIFIYKGIKIFLSDIYGLVYIILYLCAVEIVPLLLFYKGAILLSKFVEF